jgi:hypothetical protein
VEVCGDSCSAHFTGRVLRGWRSNHLRDEGKKGPVAWCTAQTFVGLDGMRRLVKKLLTKGILYEFGGYEVGATNPQAWNRCAPRPCPCPCP